MKIFIILAIIFIGLIVGILNYIDNKIKEHF
jgi:hypothetical protein